MATWNKILKETQTENIGTKSPCLRAQHHKKFQQNRFRGEDTRENFTSHLHDALFQAKLETFIDYRLQKGDEISQALIEAIEESQVSVVIFSEKYATSKWCLDEIAKIIECKEDQGQVVIPVFYKTDPAHVRKQRGSFETAFAEHERDLNITNERVQKWREALTEAANLSGWDSRTYSSRDIVELEPDSSNDIDELQVKVSDHDNKDDQTKKLLQVMPQTIITGVQHVKVDSNDNSSCHSFIALTADDTKRKPQSFEEEDYYVSSTPENQLN
ncbi:TMV resistance protein N [Spatholobus suberectus]|nr:TMV resistance protein N [Spatholobus suberectus]